MVYVHSDAEKRSANEADRAAHQQRIADAMRKSEGDLNRAIQDHADRLSGDGFVKGSK